MEPKTFRLPQDYKRIAKVYGGHTLDPEAAKAAKRRIAQAAFTSPHLVDTLTAQLAGQYIDSLPQQYAKTAIPADSVFSKTLGLAPPAPPAGLGAIGPQGGAMPPVPPPPPAGLGAMPPVGMAAGGMTELPASYGLDSLPIPDNMYDEQSFAGGGIVAFSGGGLQDQIARLEASLENPNLSSAERQSIRNKLSQLVTPSRANPAPSRLADRNMFGEQPRPSLSGNARLGGYTPRVVAPEGFRGLGSSAGSKSDPGIVNMDSYDPNRSSPETQLAAILGGSSTPVATQLGALLGRTETAPLGERGERGAPRGERGVADVAGGATRTGTATPEDDYGLPKAPGEFDRQKFFDEILKMQGPAPGMEKMSDEEKAARKNEDFYGSLLEFAANLAGGASGNFLTDAGKAMVAASPGVRESLKERRAEAKEERKDELERKRLEYGARGTAAAATRAEEATMRTHNLNLAEARAKIAHDRATLALDIRKANDLAGYYRQMGRDKDAAMVDRLSNALQRIAKNPNDEKAIAERDAIQQLQGRGLGLNRGKLTPDQALRQATNETKSLDFVLPKGMTVQQYIDARKLELMGSGGGVSNPEIDDIVNQYT